VTEEAQRIVGEQVVIDSGESAVDWLLRGKLSSQTAVALLIVVLSTTLSFLHFYSTYFGQAEPHIHRSTHLALMLVLAFLFFPLGRKSWRDPLRWTSVVDFGCLAIAIGSQVYTLANIDHFLDPAFSANQTDIIIGTLLILVTLEATRRTVGLGLSLTAVFFLLQTWQADKFFWIFYGPPTPWRIIVERLFGGEDGLYGIPMGIMSSILILFILFSAFLSLTGIGDFFVKLATGLAGHLTGGPAKVSVFSSALLGTISGSGVANVLMDGVFTIPMMKRTGYSPSFAAAVEATASIGGQLMPPIMAAAAFIMADFVGIPFRSVALAATIPALLYFYCVFVTVHFEARKLNLRRLPRDELPSVPRLMARDGYLLLPIAAIIYFLYQGYSEETAGLMAIIVTVVVSFIRRDTAFTPVKLLKAFETGAQVGVTVAMAVACAGLIIGCLFLSGIGMKFSYILVNLSGGQLWLALIYTTIAAFLLGLSLPTTAVYLTLAIIVAPGLVNMGVPKLAAHMFIFYMGVTSDLTPPTCISPFAAAGIAGANPMQTALQAMRLGIVLYIVPFMFVYAPALLMMGSATEILLATTTALLGVTSLAIGLQGWCLTRANIAERSIFMCAALPLIVPGLYTDLAGLGLMGVGLASQLWQRKPPEAG
jgi:TRAP transporter 4TM/12TM fusion protein